ncbi:sugar-binding protein [Paracidovorax avenae]|uniref:glycoside hydrolase family 98 domain-containing protein n=1 Tax=Paracidovorax avenae TaxID=80867 RepID=UPI000D21744E|nr:glycoside hydrolase family 98 domain-containing protein [Paracidovorax avenae]AVS79097.1 sugar-binding protein [Paracidovorax avenae]
MRKNLLPRSRAPLALAFAAVLTACGGGESSSMPSGAAAATADTRVSTKDSAAPGAPLRRPVSPQQPMFLVHVDTWNSADPQKIIDLIPQDVRPYTVLVLSLSILHDDKTSTPTQCRWRQVENGIETARSWIKVAADNRMWAMVQPSSGGFTHFPDYDGSADLESTVYGEFFRDYPNFLGFNYAEQFWGFDQTCSPSADKRWEHWANLLKLTNKYGGYLDVSFTGGFWGAALNPLAMAKRSPVLEGALRTYARNFIIEEKFTANYGFHDNESVSLGMYLSGYAGNYGIRTDRTGWYNADGSTTYPVPAGAPHLVEHLALTGQTVFDGPELIMLDMVRNLPNGQTADGYSTRRWDFHPQFRNIHLDIYRKILDGTLRIPSRKEVIDRTRVAIVNDVSSGSDRALYSTPETLFSGLYAMDGDGTYLNQHSWTKKTGRYPAIPTVWRLTDDLAQSFQTTVKKSEYASRWSSPAAKVAEFDALFPQETTGDIYAGRLENTWVTYNPYRTSQAASGSIPFKYNTCAGLDVTYPPFTTGVVKEYPGKVTIYLTNYDPDNAALKKSRIAFRGAAAQPAFSFQDRGDHPASQVSGTWANGVLTLDVAHNGALDLTVKCSGTASGRLSGATDAAILAPDQPPVYTGTHQYEAEHFDFRNTARVVANGVNEAVRNYQGLGYVNFGTSSAASLRGRVQVPLAGSYRLLTRYAVAGADVGTIDVYVNGVRAGSPVFTQTTTASDWAVLPLAVTLQAGVNTIEFRARATAPASVYFDNVALQQ